MTLIEPEKPVEVVITNLAEAMKCAQEIRETFEQGSLVNGRTLVRNFYLNIHGGDRKLNCD